MTGETIELEANGLRFRALAEGTGDPVLCLHGFPDHYQSFRHQLPMLADNGYRAVAPMMRGYEPSSQPVCTSISRNRSFVVFFPVGRIPSSDAA